MQQDRTRTVMGRKRRRTREQWRTIIRAFEASGQSPQVYCREQGLTPSVLGKWNRVFRSESGITPFIELPPSLTGVLSSGQVGHDWRVELELGAGVVLRLR